MASDKKEYIELAKIFKSNPIYSRFTVGDMIGAIREIVEEDLRNYVMNDAEEDSDPAIVACIEACINHLGDAITAYNASLE